MTETVQNTIQNPAVLLVDVPALLKMLSIGRSRFYEAASSGEFGPEPVKVFGRKKLYRFADVELWVKLGCPSRSKFLKAK